MIKRIPRNRYRYK